MYTFNLSSIVKVVTEQDRVFIYDDPIFAQGRLQAHCAF